TRELSPGALEGRQLEEADWREIQSISRSVGRMKGRTVVVLFSDCECPYCKSFHALLRPLEDESPGSLDVRLVHFPLEYHRFALPAARLAECIEDDAEVGRLTDVIFSLQDSLGLVSWSDVTARANVTNGESI